MAFIEGATIGTDTGNFPVFDEHGNMLGNITSIQGQQPTANSLTSDFTSTAPTGATPVINPPGQSVSGTSPAASTSTPKTSKDCAWYDVQCQFSTSFQNTFGGGTGSTSSGNSVFNATVAGVPIGQFFETALIFGLGVIFVIGGLFLLAKDTDTGKAAIKAVAAMPK